MTSQQNISDNQVGGIPIPPSQFVYSSTSMSPFLSTVQFESPLIEEVSFVSPSIFPGAPPTLIKGEIIHSPVIPRVGEIGAISVRPMYTFLPADFHVPFINFMADTRDVCDVDVIKTDVVKMYYYKFLDKWLLDEDKSLSLLKFLIIKNGVVELAKDLETLDDLKKNSNEDIKKKVEFIEKNMFTIDDVKEILERFTRETRASWCDLGKHRYFIREAFNKSLKNKFKRLIKEKKSKY